MLIHEGVKAEEFEKTGKPPDPNSAYNAESQLVLVIIHDGLKTDPKSYLKMKARLVVVSEETTPEVKRLYQMQANGTLLFIAKSKPTREMIREIAVLELEVIYLEHHLLFLYRKVFDLQISAPPPAGQKMGQHASFRSGMFQDVARRKITSKGGPAQKSATKPVNSTLQPEVCQLEFHLQQKV